MEDLAVQGEDSRVRFNVWLSKKTYDSLAALGNVDNRSMSDLIREALRAYIDQRSHLLEGDTHG